MYFNPSKNDIIINKRLLFMREGCPYCRLWKSFVERINLNLEPDKRIIIVDCTDYENYGIAPNNIIKFYRKQIKGYPTLFFDGVRIDGANTRGELEQWAKILLEDDFIVEEKIDYKYAPHCHYEKRIFRESLLVCET